MAQLLHEGLGRVLEGGDLVEQIAQPPPRRKQDVHIVVVEEAAGREEPSRCPITDKQ